MFGEIEKQLKRSFSKKKSDDWGKAEWDLYYAWICILIGIVEEHDIASAPYSRNTKYKEQDVNEWITFCKKEAASVKMTNKVLADPKLKNGKTCYLLPMKDGIPDFVETNMNEISGLNSKEIEYPTVQMVDVEHGFKKPFVVKVISAGSFGLYYHLGEEVRLDDPSELVNHSTPIGFDTYFDV